MKVLWNLMRLFSFWMYYTLASSKTSFGDDHDDSFQETFKILAVAGKLDKDGYNLTSDVELINPFVLNSNCTKPANYPLKTSDITGSGGVICGGGFENTFNDCFEYSYQNQTWLSVGRLNDQRYGASSVFLNGNYWITGGGLLNGRLSLVTSEMLKGKHSPFIRSSDLPEQMRHHCMSVVNDTHVFIAGGDWSWKSTYLVDISVEPFIFNKLPPMMENRSGAACGTIVWPYSSSFSTRTNDFLVIVAGGDNYGSTDSSTTSEFYSPLANVWVSGPILPRGFINGGYFTTRQFSLVMVGGKDENGNERSDVMALGSVMGRIEFLPGKLKTPREAFAAIEIITDEECS